MFSLQKEFNLEKYDLLEDFIEKIKVEISFLLSRDKNDKQIKELEKNLIQEWLSIETIEEIRNYKIKNSLFKYRSKIKKIREQEKKWKKQITLKNDNFLADELFKTFSKNILFSAYLSNLMYYLSKKDDFWEKDLEYLKLLFKFSTMAEEKSYISYRALWSWLIKIWKKLEKEWKKQEAEEKKQEAMKNLKKTLKIYPLDSPAWEEIWKMIWWKNKYLYISFIISAYNTYKIYKESRRKLLKEETYKSFNLNKKEFDKIIEILKTEKFNELLEFLP